MEHFIVLVKVSLYSVVIITVMTLTNQNWLLCVKLILVVNIFLGEFNDRAYRCVIYDLMFYFRRNSIGHFSTLEFYLQTLIFLNFNWYANILIKVFYDNFNIAFVHLNPGCDTCHVRPQCWLWGWSVNVLSFREKNF